MFYTFFNSVEYAAITHGFEKCCLGNELSHAGFLRMCRAVTGERGALVLETRSFTRKRFPGQKVMLPNVIDVQSYGFKMSTWEETHWRPLRICHLKQVRSNNWDGVRDRVRDVPRLGTLPKEKQSLGPHRCHKSRAFIHSNF